MHKRNFGINTKGQIWIETVLYTIIGLALIAVVLAFATPKINASKDKIIVDQSIKSMQILGEKIDEVASSGAGTRSIIEFNLKKGSLTFDLDKGNITLVLNNLNGMYSEDQVSIPFGRVTVISTKGQKYSSVNITLPSGNTLSYAGSASPDKVLTASPTPYTFSIEKKIANGGVVIDIDTISG